MTTRWIQDMQQPGVVKQDGLAADRVRCLALVVGQVDPELFGQQVAREPASAPVSISPSSSVVFCSPLASDTYTNGLKTGSPSRTDWGSSRYG